MSPSQNADLEHADVYSDQEGQNEESSHQVRAYFAEKQIDKIPVFALNRDYIMALSKIMAAKISKR